MGVPPLDSEWFKRKDNQNTNDEASPEAMTGTPTGSCGGLELEVEELG
jgi:hypothetical protein